MAGAGPRNVDGVGALDRALAADHVDYPERLRDLDHPPDPLYLRGAWNHAGPVVAIVGSRNVPAEGIEMARRIAADLAREGVAVVSGLATGVDAAAHQGALDAGGRTGAVLGTPLDQCYPRDHDDLQRAVCASLGVMSELSPDSHGTRGTFQTRNRIIAALAHAVLVVQAGDRSGALHTVEAAERLGRPVGAMPWHADEIYGALPHRLIRERRAILVRHAADMLELLGERASPVLLAAQADRRAGMALPAAGGDAADTSATARVLAGLSRRAEPLDVVAARATLGAAETSAALLSLELAGLARREPGGRYRLARGA